MNNVGKPALYNLTHPTIGTFFPENHLNLSEKFDQELNDTSNEIEVIEKYRDKIKGIGVVIYELTESEGIMELALDCLPINTKSFVDDFWSDFFHN
jgi:hypothetical protein